MAFLKPVVPEVRLCHVDCAYTSETGRHRLHIVTQHDTRPKLSGDLLVLDPIRPPIQRQDDCPDPGYRKECRHMIGVVYHPYRDDVSSAHPSSRQLRRVLQN
jgi:hypothetical protein